MGRAQRPQKSVKPSHKVQRNTKAANVAGYAKRQSRQSKTPTEAAIANIYEHQQEKVRRGKVKLQYGRDELIGAGRDDSGSENDDMGYSGKQRAKPRLVGEGEDSEQIGEDEDEEIDSDEASSNDGSDNEALEQEALGGEGSDDEEPSEDESDEEDGSDAEDQVSALEEDGEDSAALQELERFVTGLDAGQKRKMPDGNDDERGTEGDGDGQRERKRRLLKEKTEAGEENEFAAHLGSGKLKLEDLLAPLTSQSSNLASLRKSAKLLVSQSGGNKTLTAPLPQRVAERLDREAAYEQTKEEVDKWKATMQRIKEAEHLSFPLQAQPTGKTSNLELAAKFKPTTELESAVDRLLKSAKLRDDDIAQTESLKMNHLSVEEVATRRAELAKMRDLMFRAEAKAKRVAKIKSKTYRRMKKKERGRLAAKLGEGEEDEDEEDENVRMRRETERARERATLRHKNTGKWAKAMKGRGELDQDQRREISEMLERGEKLRRKIRGDKESGDEESDEESDDGESGEDAIQQIKTSAFEELASLNDGMNAGDVVGRNTGKSIFEMKFMKNAMTREQRKVDEIVDDFVKEMGGPVPDEDVEGEVLATGEERPYGTAVQRTGGRVTYRPGAPVISAPRPGRSFESDTSSVTLKSTDLVGSGQPDSLMTSPVAERSSPLSPPEVVNPWLVRADGADRPLQKKHEIAISKSSASAEKSKNRLWKRQMNLVEEKEKAQEDAAVDIVMTNVLTLDESSHKSARPSPKHSQSASITDQIPQSSRKNREHGGSDSDANSEVDEQEMLLAQSKGKGKGKGKANGVQAFEQRDLVALAFAGDNVVQEFAEQKRREMKEDAPHEVDTTLPGWGSWGGKGAKKAPPKPHLIKKIAGIDPSSRADYKKPHVIISEKRDKKAAKYLVKDLPFPYTSKAQFERSLAAPLGTEWNTRVGFQRATLPRVVTKPGTIISPLEKLT
ncbi:uncharacterized protein FIBRA_00919 [Fibroporia radiculosa]|uniref:Utp14-domain-containing protein n=1 Tax=Fibroporia radiculosa TaxID=599839 RepID=J4HSG9_9APHY|nr:uncharacterized protein FIBRA_00919 [Fibroporia radiculosa]CCL98912.1 predicted protein [Fibroporia radiculosa]